MGAAIGLGAAAAIVLAVEGVRSVLEKPSPGERALERIERAGGPPVWFLGPEFEGLELRFDARDRSVQYWDAPGDALVLDVAAGRIGSPGFEIARPCNAFEVRGVPASWTPGEGLTVYTGKTAVLIGTDLELAARAVLALRRVGAEEIAPGSPLPPPSSDVRSALGVCRPPTDRQRSLLPLREL